MDRKATIISDASIYSAPDLESRVLDKLSADEVVSWTKKRYCKGKYWLEIVLSQQEVGYVLADNVFVWVKCKLRNTSLRFVDLETGAEKRIKKNDIVYKVYKYQTKVDDADERHAMVIADESFRFGKVKYASLKEQFDINALIAVISVLLATALSGVFIYYFALAMFMGGKIFFGSLIVAGIALLWTVLFKLVVMLLKTLQVLVHRLMY